MDKFSGKGGDEEMDGDNILLQEAEQTLVAIARIRNASRPPKVDCLVGVLELAGEIIDRLLTEITVDRMEFEAIHDMLQRQIDQTTRANKRLAGMVAGIECRQVGRA